MLDMNIFVASIVKSLPICDVIIDEICTDTTSDHTVHNGNNHCQTGSPEISGLTFDVHHFAHSYVYLILCDGLLMYNIRIVVPLSLRSKIFDAFHDAHQGLVKSIERARSSVW